MAIWGLKEQAGEHYEPSNGTEGMCFHEGWCCNCERDKVMNGTATQEDADRDPSLYCEILNQSFCDGGAKEWQFDKNGDPCCTAFVPMGETVPPPRDDKTIDMFEGAK
jgi:hypothetical protein